MTTLTTDEIALRLDAALVAEYEARTALEALQLPETAGDEPTTDERNAVTALAKAAEAVARLEAALSVAEARDAATARQAAALAVETDDNLTGKALTDVQDAADDLTKAIEAYVGCYTRLARAWSLAQGKVNYNPRLPNGAGLPNPEHAVADELARISVTKGDGVMPPGASTRAVQYGDVHSAPPLSETFATHTRAYVAALAETRGAA